MVWIWVIEVEVSGLILKLLNYVFIGKLFIVVLICCFVSLLLNGVILFCNNVSWLVICGGKRLWWVDNICLNLI